MTSAPMNHSTAVATYGVGFTELCPPSWGESLSSWTDYSQFSIWTMPFSIVSAILNSPTSMKSATWDTARYYWYGETDQEQACRQMQDGSLDLKKTDALGRTVFSRALDQGQTVAAQIYKFGTDAAQRDVNRSTSLHQAVSAGALDAVRKFAKEMNVNARNVLGQTPAHLAAAKGDVDLLRALLSEGANFNVVDLKWRSPLMLAAQTNYECFDLIAQTQPNWMLKDKDGRNLWHYAATNRDAYYIMNKLMLEDVPMDADAYARHPIHYAAKAGLADTVGNLLYYFNAKDKQTSSNISPAHLAAYEGHVDVLNTLAAYSCSLSSVDAEGRTPLHWAAKNGKNEAVLALLYHNVPTNPLDKSFKTPAQLAAEYNQEKALASLISKTDLNLIPQTNQSALYVAIKKGFEGVASLLKSYHAPLVISDRPMPLHEAIINKEYGKLQLAIINRPINAQDADGVTPLMLALMTHQPSMALSLIEAGANLVVTDNQGATALHHAASSSTVQIVQALIKQGANPLAQTSNQQTPLHYAVQMGNLDTAQFLASIMQGGEKGIDVAAKGGSTPLHLAILTGDLQMVKMLLAENAVPLVMDNDRRTSIHLAAMKDRADILKELLVTGQDAINWKDSFGRTPLYYAGVYAKEDTRQMLIEHGAVVEDQQHDALSLAIMRRNGTHIKQLLQEAAPALIASKSYATTKEQLHLAFEIGDSDFSTALTADLAGTSILNNVDATYKTFLHTAAESNDLETAIALMNAGIELDAKDQSGQTALHHFAIHGNIHALMELAKRGANLSLQDVEGYTALDRAMQIGQFKFAEKLKSLGGSLLLGTADVETGGSKALLQLALRGKLEDVKDLIDQGAFLNVIDHQNKGALHYAAQSNEAEAMIGLLLRHGLNPNTVDGHGNTPLHAAVAAGNLGAVRVLLENYANPQIKNNQGTSVLSQAKTSNNQALQTLLNQQ